MKDGSEMLFLGLTARDIEHLVGHGQGVRFSPDDLRKAGMKDNNFSVAILYEETEEDIIQGVKATGVETEQIYETAVGDLVDPG